MALIRHGPQSYSNVSHRLIYSLPPSSCDGDPAPSLELPLGAAIVLELPTFPNGDRVGLPAGGSIGDVFPVDDPDFD